jgi:PAS domain S-box-containing protein
MPLKPLLSRFFLKGIRLPLAVALLWLGLVLPARAQEPAKPEAAEVVITDLPSYWQTGARDRARPIKMEALVNYYDGGWNHLWVDVKGELGYLRGATKLPIQSGDRILIEGTVIPSNGISADTAKITVLEHNVRRSPLEVAGQLSEYSRLKSQFVTFEATFDREQTSEGNHLVFDLVADGYRVRAFCWYPDPVIREIRQGSRVRVTGVYNANHDPGTQSLEVDIWCSRLEDIVLLGEPENDPRFGKPVVSIDTLTGIYAERGTKAHIAGVVRANSPGSTVRVRDETGEVLVQTLQTLPLQIGDWVEAVGDPITGGTEWFLRGAIVRRALAAVVDEKKRAAASAPPQLRLIDQVLALNPQEAAAGRPVNIVAVILWSHPEADFMYVGDTSGAVRVQLSARAGSIENRPSNQLRIAGKTRQGAFAPEIALRNTEQLGSVLLPEAKEMTLDQAMTGLEEGRRISLRGHVQRVKADGVWSRLTVSTQTGIFSVLIGRDDNLNSLLGSIVSVRGVCRAIPNSRRQLTGIEILVTNRDEIQVEQPALTNPFAAPLRELSALRQFNVNGPLDNWVRVRGIVTQYVPGRFAIVQDGAEGLKLLSEQKDVLAPGDQIEVTGLPGFENGRVALRESVYRKLEHREQPEPFRITELKTFAEELDSRLVTVRGALINRALDGENLSLEIQSGQLVFAALLPRGSNQAVLNDWRPGSELELTGVYDLIRDERRQPRSFRLQLRSPADVLVLQNPSWWTPERALAVTGLLVGCIALGLTWVAVLRRRVTKQTDQLRVQILNEAKLEAHNRAIVENASDCIFTTDQAGNFTSFNPAGERLLGYNRAEIMKLNLRDLIATEDTVGRPELIASLAGKDQPAARFELRLVTKDQRRIWTEISACLVHTEGELVGILGVARDIGDRKQIEEELKRARDAAQANTEAKSAFLANMSHEIRTPMNGVIGMSNMILETRLSTEQREFAETIRNSAESLLTVLNDILDFSKIEAGKLHFETLDFDLAGSVEECLDLLTSRASEKQIDLSLFIPPELPRLVRGDPGRLRQVLLNLVGNALKFTNKGEVAVSVSAEQETAADLTIRFEVRDSGVGIASEGIARLFQPFSQADVSTTRRFGGTGLGLAISKQIVQLMQGKIGVISEPGQGSTFWFTVRLAKQPSAENKPSKSTNNELAGLRVLAVDDNAPTHRVVATYGSFWGLRCTTVSSAAEALDALRQAADQGDPYRVALLDGQLPEVEGLVLAETVRADRRFESVALIILTWPDRRVSAEVVQRLMRCDVITKPLHPGELLQAIGRATMPAETATAQKKASTSPIEAPQKPAVTARILVAEDNAVNQRLILHQLKKLGYQANIASNGTEAVRALEVAPYDLVLMDCQMPEMDGYETTRVMRRDPRFAHLQIVAMTANAMQGDREKCLEAGMDDYLSKPTRIDELRAVLNRCLSQAEGTAKESRSRPPFTPAQS